MKLKNKKIGGKEKILIAAAKLFRERSFLNTSVDSIASSLKINKAMIYYYFPSKRELLYEIMSSSLDERIRDTELIMTSNAEPIDKLKLIIGHHIEASTNSDSSVSGVALFELKNLPRNLRKSYVAKRDKYEEIFRNILAEGISKCQFKKGDISMKGRFILGLINSVATWYKEEGRLSRKRITEEVWKFLLPSIRKDYDYDNESGSLKNKLN